VALPRFFGAGGSPNWADRRTIVDFVTSVVATQKRLIKSVEGS